MRASEPAHRSRRSRRIVWPGRAGLAATVLAATVLAAGALAACARLGSRSAVDSGATSPRQRPTDVTAEDYEAPPLPRARVRLRDAFGGERVVEVEVAHTEPARRRGLMWRRELRDGAGMLFVFGEDRPQSFWMRNTLVSLDMIFIDAALRVVDVIQRAEPLTLSPRASPHPAKYVLEVPAGYWGRVGLRVGGPVRFEGLEGLVPEP